MFTPFRRNAITLTAVLGAAGYFFQYFKINGLEQLTLAPRDPNGFTASDAGSGFSGGLGSGNPAPFPSTSSNPTSGANYLPFQSSRESFQPTSPSNGLLLQGDRWASNAPLPSMNQSSGHAGVPVSTSTYASPSQSYERAKIRLGVFHVNGMDLAKLNDPILAERYVQIVSEFSCVALQGVAAESREVLPVLMQLLHQRGKQYEYVVGEATLIDGRSTCLAFAFDATKLEVDRYQTYTLNDPEDVLRIEPLVGWFRSREVANQIALTFTFVNLKLSVSSDGSELGFLPDILSSIRQDGRNEDDIVLAGQFAGPADAISAKLDGQARVLPLVNEGLYDASSLFIALPATSLDEFTGNTGYLSIYRRYNLTPEQAAAVSPTNPVWAEFYAAESGAIER